METVTIKEVTTPKKPQGTPYADREKSGGYAVVKNLLARHEKMIDLAVEGQTPHEMSKTLGVPYRQIYNIHATPAFQHKLGLRRERMMERVEDKVIDRVQTVQEYLADQTMYAATRLRALMDSPNDGVARQATNDVLDRTGFAKVTKNENINTSVEIDSDMAKTINETMKMLKKVDMCSKVDKVERFDKKAVSPHSACQADLSTPQPSSTNQS